MSAGLVRRVEQGSQLEQTALHAQRVTGVVLQVPLDEPPLVLLSSGNSPDVAVVVEMSSLWIVALVGALTSVIIVLGFYWLCAHLTRLTGGTACLRDLAVALEALALPSARPPRAQPPLVGPGEEDR